MIVVMAHGFAHRLTNAGVVESSKEYINNDDEIFFGEWIPRTAESMDLSGGDFSEITSILQRLSDLFSDDSKRLASVTETATFFPDALTSR